MANEKRLISYDVLIAHLDSCIAQSKGLFKSVCVAIKCFVEQMPTVDADPIVKGHWAKHNFLGHEQWVCSECQTLGSPQWKRCPVCEAKMDGGNEDV